MANNIYLKVITPKPEKLINNKAYPIHLKENESRT